MVLLFYGLGKGGGRVPMWPFLECLLVALEPNQGSHRILLRQLTLKGSQL